MQVLPFAYDGCCGFVAVLLQDLEARDIREFAAELADGGRAPATVSSYIV